MKFYDNNLKTIRNKKSFSHEDLAYSTGCKIFRLILMEEHATKPTWEEAQIIAQILREPVTSIFPELVKPREKLVQDDAIEYLDDLALEDLEINSRVYKALKNEGFNTAGEVIILKNKNLMKIKGFSTASFYNLKEAIACEIGYFHTSKKVAAHEYLRETLVLKGVELKKLKKEMKEIEKKIASLPK